MTWLAENWITIASAAIPIIIAIIHAVTKHYTESKGLTRALLLGVDILNVLGKALKPSDPPKTLKVYVNTLKVPK